MDAHIDWLSWTLQTEEQPRTASQLHRLMRQQMKGIGDGYYEFITEGRSFDTANPRTPYRVSMASEDNGVRIYGASHTETTLYELSGRGCSGLRDHDLARAFLEPLQDRVTRLDIAVDIRTETRPSDFSNARSHNNFRSVSFISSTTGETCYVGSPKSDRFCRVYRYHKPHPRSELLRVEFVFRKALAKAACRQYVQTQEVAEFVAQLGNTWGWKHADWQPEYTTDERVKAPSIKREDEQTVAWLYRSVAPALARLMAESDFDIVEWLDEVYQKAGKTSNKAI